MGDRISAFSLCSARLRKLWTFYVRKVLPSDSLKGTFHAVSGPMQMKGTIAAIRKISAIEDQKPFFVLYRTIQGNVRKTFGLYKDKNNLYRFIRHTRTYVQNRNDIYLQLFRISAKEDESE